jgi:hypothetical protein
MIAASLRILLSINSARTIGSPGPSNSQLRNKKDLRPGDFLFLVADKEFIESIHPSNVDLSKKPHK